MEEDFNMEDRNFRTSLMNFKDLIINHTIIKIYPHICFKNERCRYNYITSDPQGGITSFQLVFFLNEPDSGYIGGESY
jgi:hypothetical protein